MTALDLPRKRATQMVMTSGKQGRARGKIQIGTADPSLTAAGGMIAVTELCGKLALIEALDAGIGNLLDMSRLATGSLQPFLRPTSVEEVAPAALLGLAPASSVRIAVPDDLPLVRTDPVLLGRVLANVFSHP